jgi:hypothetical protein
VALDRRRLGILALLVEVLGALLVTGGPDGVGAIQLAGVSVAWWYGLCAGPLVAALVASLALAFSRAP